MTPSTLHWWRVSNGISVQPIAKITVSNGILFFLTVLRSLKRQTCYRHVPIEHQAERIWRCQSSQFSTHGNLFQKVTWKHTFFHNKSCRWAIVCGLKTCWKQWKIHEGRVGNSNQEVLWGWRNQGRFDSSGLTVDGRNPAPVEVGSLSHYLQGFIYPRWCRISSINSMTCNWPCMTSRDLDPWNSIRIPMDTLKPTIPTNKCTYITYTLYIYIYYNIYIL